MKIFIDKYVSGNITIEVLQMVFIKYFAVQFVILISEETQNSKFWHNIVYIFLYSSPSSSSYFIFLEHLLSSVWV